MGSWAYLAAVLRDAERGTGEGHGGRDAPAMSAIGAAVPTLLLGRHWVAGLEEPGRSRIVPPSVVNHCGELETYGHGD